MAVPIVAVLPVEGRKVELVDDVQDEPSEMLLGEPVAQVRREQEGLVAVYAQEVVSYSLFYTSTTFAANASLLECHWPLAAESWFLAVATTATPWLAPWSGRPRPIAQSRACPGRSRRAAAR
jgi:hypothetical protein